VKHTHWEENADADEWSVAQVLVDPAEQNDWEANFTVLMAKSRAENRAVLRFEGVHAIGSG